MDKQIKNVLLQLLNWCICVVIRLSRTAKSRPVFLRFNIADVEGRMPGRHRFPDYDRLRLVWRSWWNGNMECSVESVPGDKGLSTDSWNMGITDYVFSSIAFYVRAHSGPFFSSSDDTSSRRSIGIGLKSVPYAKAFANH